MLRPVSRVLLSAIVGKPIRHIDLPEAAFREGMQAAGLHVATRPGRTITPVRWQRWEPLW